MSRLGALALVASIAACAPAHRPVVRSSAPVATGAPTRALSVPPKFFHASAEEAFWVTRGDGIDRVVAAGARLELGPTGEVLRAAWERAGSAGGDALAGSLAVADRLGGGFVHFSPHRLFVSREFTGALEPVALRRAGEPTIRGLRNGLDRVIVLTDAGTFAIWRGAREAVAMLEPGLLDEAALDDRRAARVDVLGRAATTADGGAHWLDASAAIGTGARSLGVTPTDLWIETAAMRYPVEASGVVVAARAEPAQGNTGGMRTTFIAPRAALREKAAWGFGDATPLLNAIAGGARLPDGSALAIEQGATARIDLASGEARAIDRSFITGTMPCRPFAAPDAVLLLCAWERYEGYGAYVLRSIEGRSAVLERAFTDDGVFIADDEGRIGFAGSCRATSRAFDPGDVLRVDANTDTSLEPKRVFCVRRAPGVWIEHTFDGPETPIAWAPRANGAAVVVVGAPAGPAPELPLLARGAPRVVDRGALRVVRVDVEIAGWVWPKPEILIMRQTMGGARSLAYPPVLREITGRDDGGIDAWLASNAVDRSFAGVSIDVAGHPVVHDPPPGAEATVIGGRFGLSIATDGGLFETTDHGRSWSAAGASPVPTASVTGSCSALGCALEGFARVGWGEGHVPTSTRELSPDSSSPSAGLPRLVCTPTRAPEALRVSHSASEEGGSSESSFATGYGDAIEIVAQEQAPAKEHKPPRTANGHIKPSAAEPAEDANAEVLPKKRAAALRTHSLLWRVPFDPTDRMVSLDATEIAGSLSRGVTMTPLLAKGGEVELLVFADAKEALVAKTGVSLVDAYEPGRFGRRRTASGGVITAGGRGLILADNGRARSIEEHGPSPQRSPTFAGVDRDLAGKRELSLAKREDGAVGLLVVDPAPDGVAGIARLDPVAASFGPIEPLARWSTLLAARDPRCKPARDDFRALLVVDTAEWLALDATALPGVTLSGRGMALVRWSKDRVCLEALDASVEDARRSPSEPSSLVVHYENGQSDGAALIGPEVRQPLRCASLGGS